MFDPKRKYDVVMRVGVENLYPLIRKYRLNRNQVINRIKKDLKEMGISLANSLKGMDESEDFYEVWYNKPLSGKVLNKWKEEHLVIDDDETNGSTDEEGHFVLLSYVHALNIHIGFIGVI